MDSSSTESGEESGVPGALLPKVPLLSPIALVLYRDAEPSGGRRAHVADFLAQSTIVKCRMLTLKSYGAHQKAWYLENGARNQNKIKLRCILHISKVVDLFFSFFFPLLPLIKAAQEMTLLFGTYRPSPCGSPAPLHRPAQKDRIPPVRISFRYSRSQAYIHSGQVCRHHPIGYGSRPPLATVQPQGIPCHLSRSSGNGQKKDLPLTGTYISPSSFPPHQTTLLYWSMSS